MYVYTCISANVQICIYDHIYNICLAIYTRGLPLDTGPRYSDGARSRFFGLHRLRSQALLFINGFSQILVAHPDMWTKDCPLRLPSGMPINGNQCFFFVD